MQVNWFTVFAQIINFLILVWLLKRYLYKPILRAVDEREKKIVAQLEDAKSKEAQALKERIDFEEKNKIFDRQKKELTDKALADADSERQKLFEKARKDAESLRIKLEEEFKSDAESSSHAITKKTKEEVFSIARKTLTDLASVSLEEQAVNKFIQRLHQLNEAEKTQFVSSFNSSTQTISIRTAFDLPSSLKVELEKTIKEIINKPISFNYQTSPELVSGIELIANGYKLTWNISTYLKAFEKTISSLRKKTTDISSKE